MRTILVAAVPLAVLAAGGAWALHASQRVLRVCSDPNNLPFSNEREEGFENRLAELVARELDARVEYTWWAQRSGFIRNTLRSAHTTSSWACRAASSWYSPPAPPVLPQIEPPCLPMAFDIAMGVRREDPELKEVLERIITDRAPEIDALPEEYGVPRVETHRIR